MNLLHICHLLFTLCDNYDCSFLLGLSEWYCVNGAHFSLLNIITACPNFLQDAGRQQEHNVLILVDFAIALMTILDQINRESFQRFKLRMGEEIFYCNYAPLLDSQLQTVPSGNCEMKINIGRLHTHFENILNLI